MEIRPVTIKFHTASAQDALQLLAEAALESPDLVKGIAKLEAPLFDASARDGDFNEDSGRVIEVAIYPTERLKLFLRALGKLPRQHGVNQAAIRPR